MSKAKNQRLERHLRAAHKEGQGIWRIEVFPTARILGGMIEAISSPDPMRTTVVRALLRGVPSILGAPRGQGPLCLTCDTSFSIDEECPEVIAVLLPERADARNATLFFLCTECCARATAPGALRTLICDKIRSSFMDDLRVIDMPGAPGRA